MKTRKNKAGFTLVELMVVAIIVAILASVAIPLMSGNRDRAIATEGQAGCTTIATQIRMFWAEYAAAPPAGLALALPGINVGDLNGTYFDDGSYTFISTAADAYTITATGKAGGDAAGETVIMIVTAGDADWSTSTLLN